MTGSWRSPIFTIRRTAERRDSSGCAVTTATYGNISCRTLLSIGYIVMAAYIRWCENAPQPPIWVGDQRNAVVAQEDAHLSKRHGGGNHLRRSPHCLGDTLTVERIRIGFRTIQLVE